MLKKPLFAKTKFVTLRIGQRQLGIFLRKAVPEVFHELKTFRAAKFQKRCEFGVHWAKVVAEEEGFNRLYRERRERRRWQRWFPPGRGVLLYRSARLTCVQLVGLLGVELPFPPSSHDPSS